jgi:N-acetyl-gamma-glutamyl-phosphate reductase
MYARLVPGTTAAAVKAAFEGAYASAPFVRLTGDALPEIKHVAYTNFCDIGWKVDEAGSRVFVVSVIDNLVKGAAGQAIQNFNVMYGLDEKTGLL